MKEKKLSLKAPSKIEALIHVFGYDAPALTKLGLQENGLVFHYSKKDIKILISSIWINDIKGLK